MATKRPLSDFERAFDEARKNKQKVFTWKNPRTGKTDSYTTELKEEADARRASRMPRSSAPAERAGPTVERAAPLPRPAARGPGPGMPGGSVLDLPSSTSPGEEARRARMMQPGSQAVEPIMPEAAVAGMGPAMGAMARGAMGAMRGAAPEAALPLSMRPPPGVDPNQWRTIVARMNREFPGGAQSTANVPMIRPMGAEEQAFARFAAPQARQVSGETGRRFSPEQMMESEAAAMRGSVARRQLAETRAGRKEAVEKAKADKPVMRGDKEPAKTKRTRYNEDEAAMEFKRGGAVKKPGSPGLYANIHAKRERIAAGSGERMRKPGAPGAPTAKAFKKSAKTAKKR